MSNNTLHFDLTARREKNLRVLKSIDENVIEIIEDYSHVAVYEFEVSQKKWDRLDVEGSLFVTRSLTDPLYSLIVLNKKGPSDFALDILNVLKISLQRPYLMLRCSTAGAPITFGIWSHNEVELNSLYSLIVRIALNKESVVAPPSPTVKAQQLLSMLKPRKDASGSSALSPVSANTSTVLNTQMSFSPEGMDANDSSNKQNGSTKKSAALLSLLKPSSNSNTTAEPENSAVTNNIANMAVADSANGMSKSMQLLSIMKAVSQSPVPPSKNTNPNNTNKKPEPQNGSGNKSETKAAQNGKSNGLDHINVHKSSVPAVNNTQAMEEDKRAELMMKLIKPRNASVDDLLTDVDIAAKVKAAASCSSAAVVNPIPATAPTSAVSAKEESTTSSKGDLLKRLLMNKSKSPEATSASSTPVPTSLPSPSVVKSPTSAQSSVPAVVPFTSPIAFQPIPLTTAATSRAAAAASPVPSTETQRSAELLAAALRNSAQNIRNLQAARSPSASPILKGLSPPTFIGSGAQGPIAWASLSSGSGNNTNGIASQPASSKSNTALSTATAHTPRSQPVLISPSDLRNIATTTASR